MTATLEPFIDVTGCPAEGAPVKPTERAAQHLIAAGWTAPVTGPTNSKGRPICGAHCHDGGTSAARKHGRGELGWMWHCNQVVPSLGLKCWRHRAES